jgi:trigger factor
VNKTDFVSLILFKAIRKMNVTFEKKDALNGTIAVNISSTDYAPELDQKLKSYQKKSNIPGFRPGAAPKSMIEKMFGTSLLLEAVNSVASRGLFDYIDQQKLAILGQPVLTDDSKIDELNKTADYTFKFDVGLAPQFELNVSDKDVFTRYEVSITDEMLNDEIDRMQRRFGTLTDEEAVADNDIIYTKMNELDENGNIIDGGVQNESVPVLISSIKNGAIKNELLGKHKGAEINVNIFDLFDNSETEISHALGINKLTVGDLSKNFKLVINEIKRNSLAELNKELFDKAYSDGSVNSVEDLKARLTTELQAYFGGQADHLFEHEMLDTLVAKQNIELPDAFLKRWLIDRHADKFTPENVDENYENEAKYLRNHLFEEKVLTTAGVKVEEADIKAAALNYTRSMFGAYATTGLNDEMLESIVGPSLQKDDYRSKMINLAVSQKVREVLKSKVAVNTQQVTSEEFFKIVADHNQNHHHDQ